MLKFYKRIFMSENQDENENVTNADTQAQIDAIIQAIDSKLESFKINILDEVSNIVSEKLGEKLKEHVTKEVEVLSRMDKARAEGENKVILGVLGQKVPNLSYYKSVKNGSPVKGEGEEHYGSFLHTIAYMMDMLQRIEQQVQDLPTNLKYYHDTIARVDTYVYDIEDTVLHILSLIETVFFYNSDQIIDRFDDYQTRAFLQHSSPSVKDKLSKSYLTFKKQASLHSDKRTESLDIRLQTKKGPAVQELVDKTIKKSLETLEERIALRKRSLQKDEALKHKEGNEDIRNLTQPIKGIKQNG